MNDLCDGLSTHAVKLASVSPFFLTWLDRRETYVLMLASMRTYMVHDMGGTEMHGLVAN
jgi:hypothetical protein